MRSSRFTDQTDGCQIQTRETYEDLLLFTERILMSSFHMLLIKLEEETNLKFQP